MFWLFRNLIISTVLGWVGGVFAQNDLDSARRLWNSLNIDRYYYEVETGFVVDEVTGELNPVFMANFRVHVTNNVVTEVQSSLSPITDKMMRQIPTFERLFDNIENAMNSDLDPGLNVTYDEEFGFPNFICIDYGDTPMNWRWLSRDTMGTITKFLPISQEIDFLTEARNRWLTFGVGHYQMTFKRLYQPEVRIAVQDGEVESSVRTDTGKTVKSETTVLVLLDELEDMFSNINPFDVDITYSMVYGYPESVDVKFYNTDDEIDVVFFAISNFSPNFQPELDEALGIWQSFDLESYAFDVQKTCPCDVSVVQPMRAIVENGSVISAVSMQGETIEPALIESIYSIEDLFQAIQNGIDTDIVELIVQYDEELGFPTQLSLKYEQLGNEIMFMVSNLATLSIWQSDLDIAMTMWQEANVESYEFTYEMNESVVEGKAVEDVFEIIQMAIDNTATTLIVDYDKRNGVPTSVFIRNHKTFSNTEISISVSLFEEITPDPTSGPTTASPTPDPTTSPSSFSGPGVRTDSIDEGPTVCLVRGARCSPDIDIECCDTCLSGVCRPLRQDTNKNGQKLYKPSGVRRNLRGL